MATAVAFVKWNNYSGGIDRQGLFASRPLTYNSSQERLHSLRAGDRLLLVSRCPEDMQYYFTACLTVSEVLENPVGTQLEQEFGRFAVSADPSRSFDLGKRFPAEGLLRAFEFDTGRPIRFGASLGQSIQTIRFLSQADEYVVESALDGIRGELSHVDAPFGLWTKCDSAFAEYFLENWRARQKALAFLLYDSPPVLTPGAPVFIHSDKSLRLLGTFRGAQFVAGHKYTIDKEERLAERERIWSAYRAGTINPPSKADFDAFWDRQNGVRSLFFLEDVLSISAACQFKTYGRALEWGYPMGVGYRYLSLSQCVLLLRHSRIPGDLAEAYLRPLLGSKAFPE